MSGRDKRCIADVYAGQPCGRPIVNDAPFSICMEHAASVWDFVNGLRSRQAYDRALPEIQARQIAEEESRRLQALHEQAVLALHPGIDDPSAVVYYLLWQGGTVKIGTTTNLPRRLAGFPKGSYVRLLATEMGGRRIEQQRHKQFAECHIDGEFFHAAQELMEHIDLINARADQESFFY